MKSPAWKKPHIRLWRVFASIRVLYFEGASLLARRCFHSFLTEAFILLGGVNKKGIHEMKFKLSTRCREVTISRKGISEARTRALNEAVEFDASS